MSRVAFKVETWYEMKGSFEMYQSVKAKAGTEIDKENKNRIKIKQ